MKLSETGHRVLKGLATRQTSTRKSAGEIYTSLLSINDLTIFRTQFGTRCNFTAVDPESGETWDRCRVWNQEGIAFNVHQCIDDSVTVSFALNFPSMSIKSL